MTRPASRPSTPISRRQRGVAIVTALLVVMLAAGIAVYLLAQQSQALTRTSRATARAQLSLYVRPTLDWSRAMLSASLKKNPAHVWPTDDWATNIAAQPIEGALASGYLTDEQGKFNLNNLVDANGKKSQPDWEFFGRLLEKLDLDKNLANAVLDWIDTDDETSNPGGAENLAYFSQSPPRRAANKPLVQVEELLRVRGFNADVLKRLSPYVTALPVTGTKINVNTAPPKLLQALFAPALDDQQVNEFVRVRDAGLYLTDVESIKKYAAAPIPVDKVDRFLDVKSDFFTATLAVTGDGAQVREQALLQRMPLLPSQWPRIIWVKDY
ncbi:MAG: type II secretion system minor pseudopilin GspK [Betaproteobacteria bacterium]|nr:type II secretion system minor pseudopilin GspK [Betaproteobacteria bacterium]